MSILTKLAALRMQERELLRVECAACGHTLSNHPVRALGTACGKFITTSHESGDPERAKVTKCKCREFQEHADPKLPL